MPIQALPYVLLTAFLFGTTLIASRFSVGQFHPLNYIVLRLLLASSGHLLVYAFNPRRRLPNSGRVWRWVGVLGVFGTAIQISLIVSSLQYLSSGLASIMLSTVPALTVMLAHFILPAERLRGWQWLGVGLALSGVVLLTITGENGLPDVTPDPTGYILILLAIGFSAVMTIYTRRYLSGFDSFDVASIRIFVATLVLVPITTLFIGFDFSEVTGAGIFAVIYAGLTGTFGGLMLQVYTITHFGAVPGAMVTYIIPLVATIGGVIALDETITVLMIASMGVILLGIALVQRRKVAPGPEGSP